MSGNDMALLREAQERGALLRVLAQDYARVRTPFSSLAGALDLLGFPMTVETLQWALIYLSDRGYIRVWRASDERTYRSDRVGTQIADMVVFAKLLPEGKLLLDGRRAEDPGVRF